METRVIADYLVRGEVVVYPTDTLYGILAVAENREAVQRVYDLKKRNPSKPFIILISSIEELSRFGVSPNAWQKEQLKKYWPGTVSVILECRTDKMEYLHRGTNSLAFRLPDKNDLIELLKITGPLIAPSANPEGLEPARDTEEARKYFDKAVACYVDQGERRGVSSTLVSLERDQINILRGSL